MSGHFLLIGYIAGEQQRSRHCVSGEAFDIFFQSLTLISESQTRAAPWSA
jgi:hypothetical protein